jgi:hypothetical protein
VISLTTRYTILACLLATAWPDVHAACPAETVMSPEQEIRTVDAVVVGKAIRRKYDAVGPGGTWVDGTYYTVRVSSVVYGSAKKEVVLFSENSSGRFPMALDKPYLLFLSSCGAVQYIDAKGNSGLLRERLGTLGKIVSQRSGARR